MIDDEVRDLMPAERRLSPPRKQQMKEQLMNEIRTGGQRPARAGATRRLLGGVVAVGALAVGGAAAAAIALNGPDPEQAAQVVENNEERVPVHLDGWRPELRAESVACIGPDSNKLTDPRQSGNTSASEFPLEELLTSELLVEECTEGNDWARAHGGFDPAAATVCVREGTYPLAVVALGGLTCEGAGTGVRMMGAEDLARLNQMRAVEVAILASSDECPTREEARTWVETQLRAHGESLSVRAGDEDGPGCYGSMTYWERGEVWIERVSAPAGSSEGEGTTQTTLAPPSGP